MEDLKFMKNENSMKEILIPIQSIGQNGIGVSDSELKSSHMYLHWMVINIPGAKVDQGQTITSYKGPAPKAGSGIHRYVIVAYEQKSEAPMRIDHGDAPFRTTFPCQVSIC